AARTHLSQRDRDGRRHAADPAQPPGAGAPRPPRDQARGLQPVQLGQRPHRLRHGARRHRRRAPSPRDGDRGAHQRQHRDRAGVRGRLAGLPLHLRDAGDHDGGAPPHAARPRVPRGAHGGAQGDERRHGARRGDRGAAGGARVDAAPVRQPRQPRHPLPHHRPGDLGGHGGRGGHLRLRHRHGGHDHGRRALPARAEAGDPHRRRGAGGEPRALGRRALAAQAAGDRAGLRAGEPGHLHVRRGGDGHQRRRHRHRPPPGPRRGDLRGDLVGLHHLGRAPDRRAPGERGEADRLHRLRLRRAVPVSPGVHGAAGSGVRGAGRGDRSL
ncbi:MAG: Cysteine synthase, partial [uncultured Gemmatimonadetes bacterium]